MICRLLMATVLATTVAAAQAPPRKALSPADVDDIAQLLMLEDTRTLDEPALSRMLQSAHPEVRRRAVVSIGRIARDGGRVLLEGARTDADTEVVANVAFASGQLRDAAAVAWLGEVLVAPKTPAAVAREAAIALGKIRTPEARAALARFLTVTPVARANAGVVGGALLAIGRFTPSEDLAPIMRWTTSPVANIRWRAAWALFRPRDPAAVPHLLRMSTDVSPEVRYWAVRGLARATAPAPQRTPGTSATQGAAGAAGTTTDTHGTPGPPGTAQRLRAAVKDPDRRVRTEALRALSTYDDDESFGIVLAALESPDPWLSVSAAEAMARFSSRAAVVGPRLVAAGAATRPLSLRVTALASLVPIAPEAALDLASLLALDSSAVARQAARQALQRLGDAGRGRLDQLTAADPTFAPARGGRGTAGEQPPPPARTLAEYRQIVERWVVPDYGGAPKPHAVWTTPRGAIEIELYPGDAPMAVDYFVHVVESGAIVGTEFGRVVPNFVAQQRTIENAATLRDEVNRRGLTRGNLSWASAGLDTGRPGYTLGHTAQPHNEGNFTALGRVVGGLDVVDLLELGDPITAARMLPRPAVK